MKKHLRAPRCGRSARVSEPETAMYLDNYHCDWDHVQVVLKSADERKCNSIAICRPVQMWDNVLGEYTQYCPKDVTSAFSAALGDTLSISVFFESETISRVTYTRADGYQVAIIKFIREDK